MSCLRMRGSARAELRGARASPDKYGLVSAFVAEFVLTAMFLFVIMGSTHGKVLAGLLRSPLALR